MIRQIFFVALFTTALIVILLFALKNNQSVPVDVVVTRFGAVPLWAVMVVSFLIGIVFSSLLFVVVIIGLYWNHRAALRELEKTRARLAATEPSAPSSDSGQSA